MNDDFIYVNKSSLSSEFCKDIIMKYEDDKEKYPGATGIGVDKNVKDTTDLFINKNNLNWKKIYTFLEKELSYNVKDYVCKLNNKTNAEIINSKYLILHGIQIQKYNEKVGKYIIHNDFRIDKNEMRCITFLWYLNDVHDGGETEFIDFKVVPEAGKLILFPASWIYPHKANIPTTNSKYIMTGWLWQHIY